MSDANRATERALPQPISSAKRLSRFAEMWIKFTPLWLNEFSFLNRDRPTVHLLNSKDVLGKVSNDNGQAAKFANDKRSIEEKINEIYLIAFSRKADQQELQIASTYVQSKSNAREGFEDVVWALINTKEFLFNH